MQRVSVHAANYSHNTSIPTASRIGPMLASSVIVGFDPGTRNMPDGPDQQVANIYTHVADILAAAGGTWDQVLKMTFYVADGATRDLVEKEWLRVFTDPDAMPARMTQVVELRRKVAVQAEFWAYLG
jgi:enamine deaminase RidA (YjgF/YER057c/UK114 family)